jgi:hypothetical protein
LLPIVLLFLPPKIARRMFVVSVTTCIGAFGFACLPVNNLDSWFFVHASLVVSTFWIALSAGLGWALSVTCHRPIPPANPRPRFRSHRRADGRLSKKRAGLTPLRELGP